MDPDVLPWTSFSFRASSGNVSFRGEVQFDLPSDLITHDIVFEAIILKAEHTANVLGLPFDPFNCTVTFTPLC